MVLTEPAEDAAMRAGPLEAAALLLLAVTPFIYLPGVTYEYAHLKLPVFQVAAALGIAALAARAARPGAWLRERAVALLPAALFLAWEIISLAWMPNRAWSAGPLVRDASMLAGFAGLAFVLSTRDARRLAVRVAVPVVAILSALVIIFLLAGHRNFFGNRNLAGGFLVLPVVAMAACLVDPPARLSRAGRLGLLLCLVLAGGAIYATASRGAVAAAAGGVLLACFVTFRRARPVLVAAAAVLAGAALSAAAARPDVLARLLGIRLWIWQAASFMFLHNWFAGVGVGSFGPCIRYFQQWGYFAHPAAAPATPHAHCQLLETGAELGVVGLALCAAVAVGLVLAARRAVRRADDSERPLLVGIACGLAGIALHGQVEVTLICPDVLIAAVFGAAYLAGAMAGPPAAARAGLRRVGLAAVTLAAFGALFFATSWRAVRAQRVLAAAHDPGRPAAERLELLQQAKQLQPWEDEVSIAARLKIAAARFAEGSLDAALAEYMEIEDLSANYRGIDANIAHVKLLLGDCQGAADYAFEAARKDPFRPAPFRAWLAALRAGVERPWARTARALLYHAQEYKPFEPVLGRAGDLAARGRPIDQRLLQELADMISLKSLEAAFQEFDGKEDEAADLYEAAAAQCESALPAVAHDVPALLAVCGLWEQIARDSRQPEIARRGAAAIEGLFDEAQGRIRVPMELSLLLGSLRCLAGREEEGRQLLEEVADASRKLLESSPGQPQALEILARACEVLDPPQAVEHARELLRLCPDNETALRIVQEHEPQTAD